MGLQLDKHAIVVVGVEEEVRFQAIGPLARGPGSPAQAIDVVSEHRKGVIEAIDRVKLHFLELSVPYARPPAPLVALVH